MPALELNFKNQVDLDLIQSQMGGQNCHIDIQFEDGTVWLARIRLDDPLLPPKPTQKYVFLSEIATLRFLEEINIPTPKVYAYAEDSNTNPVGTSYILMEKLPGAPLEWNEATSKQKTKVMSQLVDIFLELERHPLQTTGSLLCSQDVLKVSGFAQPTLFSSPERTVGPFATLESSLRAILLQQQDQIVNGEMSSLAEDNYLSHCWRRDKISEVTKYCHDHGIDFFIKHYDDKGDHILVDADFNITGIIDWEFASAEPKALAFSTPCMLWPVGDFYAGTNELSAEEIEFAELFEARGRSDMGRIVRESRKMQRFTFFNGGDGLIDDEEFQSLFTGVIAAWDGRPTSYADWKKEAKEKYKDESGLQSILRRSTELQKGEKPMDDRTPGVYCGHV